MYNQYEPPSISVIFLELRKTPRTSSKNMKTITKKQEEQRDKRSNQNRGAKRMKKIGEKETPLKRGESDWLESRRMKDDSRKRWRKEGGNRKKNWRRKGRKRRLRKGKRN